MNTLREALGEYLAMRRSLGFKLEAVGNRLLNFVTFMEGHRAAYITQALALAWAQQARHARPATCAKRLTDVRQFARYRSATDPRTQIPPTGLLPFPTQRPRPYLYSKREIEQLLHATLHMPLARNHCKRGALLPWVYYCLFGLLAVAGLRLGEARYLKLEDVDLQAGVLTIRCAKFGKDRLVPLHVSTCKVLADYIVRRERHWAGRAVSPYLFVSGNGNRLTGGRIHRTFCAASRRIGLRGPNDSHGPRLQDLRHRFATTTLVNWYRANEDPERRLPLLSAFLGHVCVSNTYWYLHASPQLMREAMRRLEHRWERRP
jgi:integrase/recombinase XerD